MPAIALVEVDAAHLHAGDLLHPGDDGPQRVPVIGVAVQRLGVEHELAAPGFGDRGRDTHLAAELVGVRALPLPMHSTSGACQL